MSTALFHLPLSSITPTFHLAAIDWVGLVLIGIPILLGLWRGLWWQVIRLVGIVAAVALARAFSLPVAEIFADRWGADFPPRVLFGTAWLIVFLMALGGATVLGLLGQKLLDAMQLGLANRFGGGLAGAATGLVLHLAVLAVLVQLSSADFIGRTVHGTYSERLVEKVGLAFPAVFSVEAAEEVRNVLDLENRSLGRSKSSSSGVAPAASTDELPIPETAPQDRRSRVR